MEIGFQSENPADWKASTVIVFCCEGEKPSLRHKELDEACPWLAIAPALNDFHGKLNEAAFLYGHPDLKLPRALLIGLGKREGVTVQNIRHAMALAARKCKELNLSSALLPVAFLADFPGGKLRLAEECAMAFQLGLYKFEKLKTKVNESVPPKLLFAADMDDADIKRACNKGIITAGAIAYARDLENLPGNMLYPEIMALKAQELAQANNLHWEIYNESALQEMGAGCIVGVGHGSTHPPRLIIIEYTPEGQEGEEPIILVGKGLTFDSGGLCLKPAANMGEMKCDMSGAAVALAVIGAAAQEKADKHIVAILACAENMPDGKAYRPGDVLTCLNSETIEVVNTDAEGRLVLADALAYAQQKWSPKVIVDIATLTGACAVALGKEVAGLFANNDRLANQLLAIGASCGENLWRLPLWPGYKDSLKSEIADIKHTASREGGAITAALFLANFIQDPNIWAHLDIAGVDWNPENKPLCPIGPTGFGVRILLELARGGLA